jgi:hypothetical protein
MEISDFLTKARDTNKEVRQLGEARIEEAALSNFGQFIFLCSMELSDDKKNKANRQLSATLIKNMLLFMPLYSGKWEKLGDDIKSEVKSAVLSTLASNDLDIRKAAALCVAGIYKLEHRHNCWRELIDILVQTCSNENQNFQTAAIMTLGYISQEINVNEFNIQDVDKILSALILILKDTKATYDVLKTTIIAFVNYICYAKKNFENEVRNNFNN